MNDPKFLRVPYAQSVHGQEEIDAVVNVLKTSTQMGKHVTDMENKVAKMFNKEYGLMTNSGTSALMLAAEASGLKRDPRLLLQRLHLLLQLHQYSKMAWFQSLWTQKKIH